MGVAKLLKHESSRKDAYRGLADCYYLPDEKLSFKLKKIVSRFETLSSKALPHIIAMRNELEGPNSISRLAIDYARLFVGPYSLLAPPYGSVYLEGKREIMGESTMDITKRYADAGLTFVEKGKEVPDHIRVELEFMSFLIFKEIEAIRTESSEEIMDMVQRQAAFMQDHLSLWVPDLTQNIEAAAEEDFYRHLALATRIFIEEDFNEMTRWMIADPDPAAFRLYAS